MSAAPARPDPQRVLGAADRLVGGERHPHARRSSAISSSVAHGCSAYSRPKRSSSASMRVAWATSQRPFASIRTLPSGPRASRTASTRAMSSASDWPRSATLTLAVRQPDDAAISCARPAGTAGTVTLTGTWARTGAGQPAVAASSALASQRALSRGPYSANGENSPQPAGPWIRAPSRTVMPAELRGHRDRERAQRPEQGLQVRSAGHGRRAPGTGESWPACCHPTTRAPPASAGISSPPAPPRPRAHPPP